jgi:hypothetical protein
VVSAEKIRPIDHASSRLEFCHSLLRILCLAVFPQDSSISAKSHQQCLTKNPGDIAGWEDAACCMNQARSKSPFLTAENPVIGW